MEYNIIQDCPPSSPDLKIIEVLWNLMKSSVARRRPSSMQELEEFTQEEWPKFAGKRSGTVRSLIISFPRKLKAMIERKRFYT